MVPAKRKRVSKKTKKSWRKNIDVKDVDDFLEDVRLDERLGYKVGDKKNDDLFHIDVEGAKPTDNSTGQKITYNLKQSHENRKSLRVREGKTPKCFEILEKRSAVSDPVVKRNGLKPREERRLPLVKKILQEKREKFVLTGAEKEAIKNRQIDQERRDKIPKRGEFNRDIWAEENDERNLNGNAYWCRSETIQHTLHNTGKRRKKIPKSIHAKTSLIAAVEPPHPAASYNPSVKAQKEIVEKIREKEKVIRKEERHLERVTTKMFTHIPERKAQQEWLKEMSGGLSPTKDDDDDDEVEGDYDTVNPPVENKKKTLQKRRKIRETNALKGELKKMKLEKRKISDVNKLRKLNEEIKKKEEEILKNIEKRKKLKEKKPFETKKLGKIKFEEPEDDFTKNEDLRGNLRQSKPSGSLLLDRYKSLQKRNIIEPLLKQKKKKRKMKAYERDSTKMGWEPKGY